MQCQRCKNRSGIISLDPCLNSNIQEDYTPLLPPWDNKFPNVIEENPEVVAKVRSEDCSESNIDL